LSRVLNSENQDPRAQDAQGDQQRRHRADGLEEVVVEDLAADEDQQDRQGGLQVLEPPHQGGQREVQRPQPQDGEHVGCVHDEGVRGDGEDGRHAVDGEHQVGPFHQHQRHQQGRHVQGRPAAFPDREPDQEALAVDLVGHREVPLQEAEQAVFGRVDGFVAAAVQQHAQPREDQERPEYVEDPGDPGDQRRAQADHDAAHDDGAQDAPEEHPVLVLAGNAQRREDHRHDEDVVQRQGFLHQITGEEVEACLGAEAEPHPPAVEQGGGDEEAGQLDALAGRGRPAVPPPPQHHQVESQQPEENGQEGQPRRQALAGDGRGQPLDPIPLEQGRTGHPGHHSPAAGGVRKNHRGHSARWSRQGGAPLDRPGPAGPY